MRTPARHCPALPGSTAQRLNGSTARPSEYRASPCHSLRLVVDEYRARPAILQAIKVKILGTIKDKEVNLRLYKRGGGGRGGV